jgi:Domain of unknown function (DUF4864)
MRSLSTPIRVWFALFLMFVAALPAAAQESPAPTPWQDVITSQVQAFRDHDAKAALSFAGQGFQAAFPSPESFYVSIMSSGYAPIGLSASHSFGTFQMVGDKSVAQVVKFLGAKQELYEAIYLLTEEPMGWRVQGVQLAKTPAIGI